MLCAGLLLLFGALFTIAVSARAAGEGEDRRPPVERNYSAAALMEANSGSFIFEDSADTRLPMASTTKIMTALVTLENCSLDELVTVPAEAVGVEGSSVYLRLGEILTVRDLLHGLMLASGNDAAVALAVHVAGSVPRFAEMMNARAAGMGLSDTRFVTPNGLDAEGHYTTARELCLIAREAMKDPDLREIVSARYYRTERGETPRTFNNKNRLLTSFEGAIGVKTGYTSSAGRCLVFAAERDGMLMIGVLLNCRPMFETASAMLASAFESFTAVAAVEAGTPVKTVFVENGAESVLELETKSSIIVLLRKGEAVSLRTEAIAADVRAPVERGAELGELRVYSGEELVGSAPLVAASSVPEMGFGRWFALLARLFAA